MKRANILKGTIIAVSMLIITAFAGGHATYAKASYTVTPGSVATMAKKNHSSKYNSYTKAWFGLNDYLRKLESAGGGTLTIKKGTYEISNALYVPSNVTIIFKDGVKFVKLNKTGISGIPASGSMWQLVSDSKRQRSKSVGKYNGTKNVKFIAQGKVTFDMKGNTGICIVVGHNKNIKISGITFKGMNGDHYLEINGSNKITVEKCYFGPAKKSTLKKYYNKEAINIDAPDPTTGGLPLDWVIQDKTPCSGITIKNCTFDGNNRGIGTHKYSQNSKGANIYHKGIVIKNNVFKNIYDNGVFVLNWKNAVVSDNKFNNIGMKVTMPYSSGAHAIAGGGIDGISIMNNKFVKVKRSAVYFIQQKNVGPGSQYKPVKISITNDQVKDMLTNTVENCGDDVNPNYAGYDVIFFKNDGTKSKDNMVAIDLEAGEITK